jgi:hypothetical protein
MKRKNLTLLEHQELGIKLKAAREILMEASCKIPNTYGKTSKLGKMALRPLHCLDLLKSELDSQVFRDYPNLADSSIYYGMGA